MRLAQVLAAVLALSLVDPCVSTPAFAESAEIGAVTGKPLPRYVSVKAKRANARRGPGTDHRIDWVFQRRGLPVRVVAEFGHWRKVEDSEGEGGWIHYALLSSTRYVVAGLEVVSIRYEPSVASQVRARMESGVVAKLTECRPNWCRIETDGHKGWVRKDDIWGVTGREIFD